MPALQAVIEKLRLIVGFAKSVVCKRIVYDPEFQMPFDVVGVDRVRQRIVYGVHAHECHLANTVEQLCVAAMSGSATKGGDAARS